MGITLPISGQQLFPQNPSTIQGPSQNSISTLTETVNNSNGDVVVSIPLVQRPGISGLDFALSVQYDSKNYDLKGTIDPGVFGGLNWDTPNNFAPDFGSGRLSIPRLYSTNLAIDSFDIDSPNPEVLNCDTGFEFRDSDGSIHSFDNTANCVETSLGGSSPFDARNRPIIDTLDGSMMRLDLSDSSMAKVILENGTVIRFPPLGGYANSITDRFGNQITFSGVPQSGMTITDSVGRVIIISNASHRITYKSSNGSDVFIDLTSTSSTGDPLSLHAENCHYFGPIQPGGDRANVIATHDLVLNTQWADTIVIDSQGDARTFTVNANALGEITKVGYPGGGYSRYTFQAYPGTYNVGDFTCGTYGVREIASKNVCDATSGSCTNEKTTTYTPTLVNEANSTISIIEPADDAGHQRKVVHDFGGSFSTVREIKESIYDSLTTLLKTTETTYTSVPGSTSNDIIWSSQPKDVTATLYGSSGYAVSSTRTHYDYDPITLVIGAPNANSTYQVYFDLPKTISVYDSSGSLLQSTAQAWNNTGSFTPDGNHILNLLSSRTVTSPYDGSYVSDGFNYDGTARLSSSTKTGSGISSIATGYMVDTPGRITQITDPKSNSTNYGYASPWFDTNCSVGATSPQPSTIQNAAGQTSSARYYSCSGLLASTTDANGATTSYTYDSLDRLKSVTQPDTGGYTMTYSSTQIQKNKKLDTRSINTLSVLDGLGRTTETRILNNPACSGSDSHVLTTYDAVGRNASTTNPYCSSSDATYGVNQTAYDALDRPTIVTRPDLATIQYCYNGLQTDSRQSNCLNEDSAPANSIWTDQIDEAGRRWQRVSDPLGRLVHVAELGISSSPLLLQTDYTYDGFGNLTSVNQHGASGDAALQRSFNYDSLSRLISATNPETGTIGYAYLLNGSGLCAADVSLPCSKTDARGVTTNYTYDPLNRLTSKSYTGEKNSDGSTPSTHPTLSSCYLYDSDNNSGTNTIGRLVAEWTQAGSCPPAPTGVPTASVLSWKNALSYDSMGRLSSEHQCAVAPCTAPSPVTYTYDLAGNLSTSTNGVPNSSSPGILATYNYDSASRLSKIFTSLDNKDLFSATASGSYGPFGLTAAQYGVDETANTVALSETRSYDNRGRILTKSVSSSATAATTTTTSVTASPAQSVTGTVVTIAVHVNCSSCGQVSLAIDSTQLGYYALDANGNAVITSASFPTSALVIGAHSVVASYQGDSTHSASTGNGSYSYVTPAQFVTVSVTPSTFTAGQSLQIHEHVNCNSACGSVWLAADSSDLGNFEYILDSNGDVNLDDSWMSLLPAFFTPGGHSLYSAYGDNATYPSAVSGGFAYTVMQTGTTSFTPTLNIGRTPFTTGEEVILSVQIPCTSNCGHVYFYIDNQYYRTLDVDSNGYTYSGTYYWSSPYFTVGQHNFSVSYSGDRVYASSSASIPFEIVNTGTQTTTATLTVPSSFHLSDNVSLLLHVDCTSTCMGMTNVLIDGGWWRGWALDSSGDLVLNSIWLPSLSSGSHTISAQFLGDLTNAPSSDTKTFVIP